MNVLIMASWITGFTAEVPVTVLTEGIYDPAYILDVFRGMKTSLRFAASARAENINGIKRLKKVTKVAAITTFVLAVCWLYQILFHSTIRY
jgi:hypothetical protein